MNKKAYEKPTCKVYELQHRTMLLAGSRPDAPDYDDWLGHVSCKNTNQLT